MKGLIGVRNYILFGGIAVALPALGLFLLFADSAEKLYLSVIALVAPCILYGAVRLMFTVVAKNASKKVVSVFSWAFIVGCFLAFAVFAATFIADFPNSYTPTMACTIAAVLGIIDYNAKAAE